MSATSSAGQTARSKTNVPSTLLESVATFKAPGSKEFVAEKRFVVDTSENARVRISWLGSNLKANFLRKTEENIAESELKLRKLRIASLDAPIIVELAAKRKPRSACASSTKPSPTSKRPAISPG
jgi:hypothetical protein